MTPSERLQALIDAHGYDLVMLATGWSLATLAQYVSRKKGQIANSDLVELAEYRLKDEKWLNEHTEI